MKTSTQESRSERTERGRKPWAKQVVKMLKVSRTLSGFSVSTFETQVTDRRVEPVSMGQSDARESAEPGHRRQAGAAENRGHPT